MLFREEKETEIEWFSTKSSTAGGDIHDFIYQVK